MTKRSDHWDQSIERLARAGIIVSQTRIRHIHGDDQFSIEWSEPVLAAAQADPRIIPLMRSMLEAGAIDNAFLVTALAKWEVSIRDENPGIDPFGSPPG